jgi:hypothetical protein
MSGARSFRQVAAMTGSFIVFSLLACSSMSVRGPGQEWEGAGGLTPGIDMDVHRGESPMYETREQCRYAPRPNGWLAIGYRRLGDECMTKDDEPYNGVLLQKVRDLPSGRIVEVCADQSIPIEWLRMAGSADSVCEGARVKEGKPTAIRILRTARD